MGFLKKLFGAKGSAQDDVRPPGQEVERTHIPQAEEQGNVSVHVLLDTLPADLKAALPEFQRLRPALKTVRQSVGASTESGLLAVIEADDHQLRCIGFSFPLPPEVQRSTIHLSNWEDAMKAPLYAHQAHIILFYDSGPANPAEQLTLLYALAAALKPLGIADETAHNAIPRSFLDYLADPERLDECETTLPSMMCTGIIKYQLPDCSVYYVTRGFNRFGLSNLAHHAPFGSGEMVMNLFDTLLNYQWQSGQKLGPGHTSENSTQFMEFHDPPSEFAEALSGGHPVLDVLLFSKR